MYYPRVPGTCLSAVLFEEDPRKGYGQRSPEKGEERSLASTRARAAFHEGILISLHEESNPYTNGGGYATLSTNIFIAVQFERGKKEERKKERKGSDFHPEIEISEFFTTTFRNFNFRCNSPIKSQRPSIRSINFITGTRLSSSSSSSTE